MSLTYTFQGDLRQARTGDRVRILHPFSVAKATDEFVQFELQVATGTSDSAVSLGGITYARMVMIFSDQAISVKVNGTGNTATKFKEVFVVSTSTEDSDAVTSLHLSNSSGSLATVTVYIIGDTAS